MMIHEITSQAGRYKQRKRVGRGPGSGGKRSGRGQKGAGSRRGHSTLHQFEGGQMPLFRTWPKFGFTNVQFKTQFWIVNIKDIVEHANFKNGGEVTPQALIGAGLIRDDSRDVKILGNVPEGGLKAKLSVNVSRVSGSARRIIEEAGGSVTETGTRRDRVRGIDRNSDDKTPKNLTKKLRRPNLERRQAAKAKK